MVSVVEGTGRIGAGVVAGVEGVVVGAAGVSVVVAGLFCILFGAANGVMTIARGAVPLAMFGPTGYGRVIGRIARPALLLQALAPFAVAAGFARQEEVAELLEILSRQRPQRLRAAYRCSGLPVLP